MPTEYFYSYEQYSALKYHLSTGKAHELFVCQNGLKSGNKAIGTLFYN